MQEWQIYSVSIGIAIYNRSCTFPEKLLTSLVMMARFFAMGCLLMLGGGFFPATIAAQTPAAITFGSIAPTGNAPLATVHSERFVPMFLTHNTTPAPIHPPSAAPPSLPFTPPPANPSLMLPPMDPFASPSQTTWFNSMFPGNTGTPGLGQSPTTGVYSGNFDRFFPETYEAIRRFRNATSFQYTHLPRGRKANGFGMDEVDIRMQLAIPCRFIPNNGRMGYFYIAPGGTLAWWNGPTGPPHMSPSGFGAFLDFGMEPRFNDTFALIAWGRLGVFSDFRNVTSNAFRYQGRLEGVFTTSPQTQFHVGVIYYGRARVKMLPTVGVVWTPDEEWVLKLVFPNPKVSRRLWRGQHADFWGYVHIEYAGGSWDIKDLGLTDYNDIRLGTGIEFATQQRIGGFFEFGGSFARELYHGGNRTRLPSVLYLKTGFIF